MILGQIFEMDLSASRLAYDVGVAGQSVTGALDHVVAAVSGEVLSGAGAGGTGGAVGVGAVGGVERWLACHGSVAGRGSVTDITLKGYRTRVKCSDGRGDCPRSGLYRGKSIEVSED